MRPALRRLAPLWLVLAAGACRSNPFGEIERADALAHIEKAEAEIAAGDFQTALQRLSAVHEVSSLDPDLRAREQRLIDQAARGRFAELADASSEELVELYDSDLPERVRARAGILAAERMLEEEKRISSFRMVKKVDAKLPGHPERVLAGDVLARAGLALIRDDRRYNLLFKYRSRGVQALEYLVVHYPLEPRCPEAYYALSEVYEDRGDLDQAIERSEELLLYHPSSPYTTGAAARLPYLRLLRLRRDDYDRGELLRAEGELETWLARHPGHELEDWALSLRQECRLRIVRSDLYLAHYYVRTDSPAGTRLHAERARALALETGLEDEREEAEELLADLPEADAGAPPIVPPDPTSSPSDPTGQP